MQEINLSEDIKEERKSSKKDRIKSHIRHIKHHHSNNHANKLDKNGLPSSSTNDVLRYNAINLHKNLECKIKKIKKTDKTHKYNDIEEDNNKIKYENKLTVNKKKIVPFNSISSNFSNIKVSEPLNLVYNKNDSLIHSIVNEMVTN